MTDGSDGSCFNVEEEKWKGEEKKTNKFKKMAKQVCDGVQINILNRIPEI